MMARTFPPRPTLADLAAEHERTLALCETAEDQQDIDQLADLARNIEAVILEAPCDSALAARLKVEAIGRYLADANPDPIAKRMLDAAAQVVLWLERRQ